jgi:hypothetical protein
MSLTYMAWAKQHQGKKHRIKAISYLDSAIAHDPDYKGGRKKLKN